MNAPNPLTSAAAEAANVLMQHRAGLTWGELFVQVRQAETHGEMTDALTELLAIGLVVAEGSLYRHKHYAGTPTKLGAAA